MTCAIILTSALVAFALMRLHRMRKALEKLVEADAEARKDLQTIHAEIVQRDQDGLGEPDELHRQICAAVDCPVVPPMNSDRIRHAGSLTNMPSFVSAP